MTAIQIEVKFFGAERAYSKSYPLSKDRGKITIGDQGNISIPLQLHISGFLRISPCNDACCIELIRGSGSASGSRAQTEVCLARCKQRYAWVEAWRVCCSVQGDGQGTAEQNVIFFLLAAVELSLLLHKCHVVCRYFRVLKHVKSSGLRSRIFFPFFTDRNRKGVVCFFRGV